MSKAQVAKYEAAVDEMKQMEHGELIEFFLWAETNTLNLSPDQCRRLKDLLTKETRHSRKLRPFRYPALLIEASRIPEAKIKPILDGSQWHKLNREFDAAKRAEPNAWDERRFILQLKFRAERR